MPADAAKAKAVNAAPKRTLDFAMSYLLPSRAIVRVDGPGLRQLAAMKENTPAVLMIV
jgi:hypothetical protein